MDHGNVYILLLEIIYVPKYYLRAVAYSFLPSLGVLYDYGNPNDVNYCPVTNEVSNEPFFYIPLDRSISYKQSLDCSYQLCLQFVQVGFCKIPHSGLYDGEKECRVFFPILVQ